MVRLEPLTPEDWSLSIVATGFARATRTIPLHPGDDISAEFLLQPGGSVVGVIRDPLGQPLEGVGLSVSSWTGVRVQKYDSREVVSDVGGRYRIDHLPVGTPLMIDLIKRGYFDGEQRVNLAPGLNALDLTLKPRPKRDGVTGLVKEVGEE